MEIFGPLLVSSIAGLSTVIGSFIIFFKVKNDKIQQFITFALSFSLSVMVCLSITDLIPESSRVIIARYGLILGIFLCILIFVIGHILVNSVNKCIEKYESNESNLYKLGILSMIALMLHNFPEGIATFMSSYQDMALGISLSIAIMMHNIPEGISIAVPIYYATGSRKKAILHTFISGLAEPFGAILAFIFLHKYINEVTIGFVLILVAGIMITLALNKLLPEELKYDKNKYIVYGLIAGAIVILGNHIMF